MRGKRSAGDAVREEGELGACAAGELHVMNLVGVAEARADEHLALGGVPVGEAGGAKLGVAGDLLGKRRRNPRDVLHDEIRAGSDVPLLSEQGACR
jgi:hypothetical protein